MVALAVVVMIINIEVEVVGSVRWRRGDHVALEIVLWTLLRVNDSIRLLHLHLLLWVSTRKVVLIVALAQSCILGGECTTWMMQLLLEVVVAIQRIVWVSFVLFEKEWLFLMIDVFLAVVLVEAAAGIDLIHIGVLKGLSGKQAVVRIVPLHVVAHP